ncbi:hypothetical protein OAM92_01500 [Acidimicrobiales bacterium]|nr:hypothetical protein [Acidimicrobiales bacterium]
MAFWKRRAKHGDAGIERQTDPNPHAGIESDSEVPPTGVESASEVPPTDSESDSEIVDLSCQLRDAIERGQMRQARTITKQHIKALKKAGKWGGVGDGHEFDEAVVEACHFTGADDLAEVVGPERVAELRLGAALHFSLGLHYMDGVLAVVADLPAERLASWGRFVAERDRPTYMWDDALQDDPGALPLVEAASPLSFDARTVLAYPKLLRRRMAVSRERLVRRTFLNPQRVDAALKELTEAGYSSPATPIDKLATLTVKQLAPLVAETDAPKSGSKARILRAIGEQVEEARIERHLKGFPNASVADIFIGAGIGKTAKFHESWARLIGHHLTVAPLQVAQRQSYLQMRTDGILGEERRFEARGGPDTCDLCAARRPAVDLDYSETWPPFHLGCRCLARPKIDSDWLRDE